LVINSLKFRHRDYRKGRLPAESNMMRSSSGFGHAARPAFHKKTVSAILKQFASANQGVHQFVCFEVPEYRKE